MKHLKRIFMLTLVLLTMNLIGFTAHAEGGTKYPTKGNLTVGTTRVYSSETEYYSLTVEETGWYSFNCDTKGNGTSEIFIGDFVEISGKEETHKIVLRKENVYLKSGSQYYARFNTMYAYPDYDDYLLTYDEYNVTIEKYSGITVTDIAVVNPVSRCVAYLDTDYYGSIKVTYSDSTTATYSDDWKHIYHLKKGFKIYPYVENDSYSSKTTTDLPPGSYTVHIPMEGFDITYPLEIISYKDTDILEVFEGENYLGIYDDEENQGVDCVLFTPKEDGTYVITANDDSGKWTRVIDAENGDRIADLDPYSDYDRYNLKGNRTYFIELDCWGTNAGLKIARATLPVSAEGSIQMPDYYLCGDSSYTSMGELDEDRIPFSCTLTYENGEKTSLTQDDRSDKYKNKVTIELIDQGTIVEDDLWYFSYYTYEPGTYLLRERVGDLVVAEKTVEIVSVSEFAKRQQLKQLAVNEKISVDADQLYVFTAPKDNHYDFTGAYKVGFEQENGRVEWTYYDSETYKYCGAMKALETCLICYEEPCVTRVYEHHYYKDFYCEVCGKVKMVDTPTLYKVEMNQNGVCINWESVENAPVYRVYRKTGSGSWTRIAEVKSNSGYSYKKESSSGEYLQYYYAYDTSAPKGQVCYYTVRCLSANKKHFISDYDHKGLAFTCMENPELTLTNSMSGVSVKWNQVALAEGYYVYRKPIDGSYTRIATVSGGSTLSYTDTKASSGITYVYAVRAFKGESKSWYNTATVFYLTGLTPTLTNKAAGTYISWTKVTGAYGYYVYRKTGSGSYSKIATVTGTNYTDINVTSGTSYTYAVRAYYGSTRGAYTGKTIKYLSAITPKLYNNTSGIKVTWTKVTGASGYYVYRKTGSGSYSKIKTITSGSTLYYTDTAVRTKKGTTYTYAVRAYNGNYLGNYTGVSLTRK